MMKSLDIDLPSFAPEPRYLLGAGPSMVDPRVLSASAYPTISHLDPRFVQIANRVQALLRYVFQTKSNFTFPVAGTGSAAMETAFANLIEPEDRVLIFTNGYFGGRMATIARKYGADVVQIECDWGDVFPLERIEAGIKAHKPKISAIVHAETSTGVAQPIKGIAQMVHQLGGYLIVDAVTSFGGMPVFVDEWGVDVCFSGTQKCLSAPPGLGPMTISERAIELIRSRKTPVASWYFDLELTHNSWGDERTYPHTAPVNAIYGLYEALRILFDEGLENCWARHEQNTTRLRDGLQDLGLDLLVRDPSVRLPMVTSVCVPDGIDSEMFRKKLSEDYGIEIAAGLGPLQGKIWRIGLMGYASQARFVDMLLAALTELLQKNEFLR